VEHIRNILEPLMVRRSTPPHITDDRFFPVRVRIAVPQGGFGEQLNVMHGWLNMHAGRGNFAIHSAPNDLNAITGVERSRVDAALFYFVDVGVARAFVERFACGVAVVTSIEPGS
jgi:hypothetical protein